MSSFLPFDLHTYWLQLWLKNFQEEISGNYSAELLQTPKTTLNMHALGNTSPKSLWSEAAILIISFSSFSLCTVQNFQEVIP